MRAKIQVLIGLIAAIVSGIGILGIFIPCLIQDITSSDAPHCPYMIFPLGLIPPILYSLALIRKKFKQVRLIFLLWCAGWLVSFVMNWFDMWDWNWFSEIGVFLEVIFAMPTYAFLEPWIDTFNVYEYSVPIRAINGITFAVFLWLGMNGLKQTVVISTIGNEKLGK